VRRSPSLVERRLSPDREASHTTCRGSRLRKVRRWAIKA
jgi:hypothetical protein